MPQISSARLLDEKYAKRASVAYDLLEGFEQNPGSPLYLSTVTKFDLDLGRDSLVLKRVETPEEAGAVFNYDSHKGEITVTSAPLWDTYRKLRDVAERSGTAYADREEARSNLRSLTEDLLDGRGLVLLEVPGRRRAVVPLIPFHPGANNLVASRFPIENKDALWINGAKLYVSMKRTSVRNLWGLTGA